VELGLMGRRKDDPATTTRVATIAILLAVAVVVLVARRGREGRPDP
jgi:hypothetical protein